MVLELRHHDRVLLLPQAGPELATTVLKAGLVVGNRVQMELVREVGMIGDPTVNLGRTHATCLALQAVVTVLPTRVKDEIAERSATATVIKTVVGIEMEIGSGTRIETAIGTGTIAIGTVIETGTATETVIGTEIAIATVEERIKIGIGMHERIANRPPVPQGRQQQQLLQLMTVVYLVDRTHPDVHLQVEATMLP